MASLINNELSFGDKVTVVLMFVIWFCVPIMSINSWMQLITFIPLFLLNFDAIKIIKFREFSSVNRILVLICIGFVCSWFFSKSYVYQYVNSWGELTTLERVCLRAALLIQTILCIEKFVVDGKIKLVFNTLLKVIFIYTIIIDIQSLFISASESENEMYLAGNKFNLTYTNIELIVLYWLKNMAMDKKHAKHFYWLSVVAILISIHSHCSTSVIALFTLLVMFRFRNSSLPEVIKKPIICIAAVVVSAVLMTLFSVFVFSIPSVNYVLVTILGESEDMTGRAFLYEKLETIVYDHPIWGYGLGNVWAIIDSMNLPIRDSQNGVLELYLQFGLYGVILYFLYIIKLISNTAPGRSYILTSYFYILLLIGTIEVPFGIFTLFFLTLIYVVSNYYHDTINY